jgi:ABC-type glutathione transport system ATPase component
LGALLEVVDLRVCFGGEVEALRGVTFSLERGESLAVIGETGSGKSTLAHSLVGLVQPPEAQGSVLVAGEEVLGAASPVLRSLRWKTAAIALQGAPFNPVATIGAQVAEPLRDRRGMSTKEAFRRAEELAAEVLLDPAVLERYPHEVSGGERRRATLAMVLALDPDLVMLDEPTAGLDPVTGGELVRRIRSLTEARGFALVVISHDLSHAAVMAGRSLILYAGEAMEVGPTDRVLANPAHPYSSALLNAYPVMSTTKDLRPIRGRPPDHATSHPAAPITPAAPRPRPSAGRATQRSSHPEAGRSPAISGG